LTTEFQDKRSKKIVVCCHCILNQNSKLEGIAGNPGMIEEVVQMILNSGAGILQMGCPEMIYEGIGRFDKSYEQYDCPAFRKVCDEIAETTVLQLENYLKWGYEITTILAVDGSPSCGYNLTQSAPEWKGLVANTQWDKVKYIKKPGILFEQLGSRLNGIDPQIPIVGIPELPELGNLDETLEKLKTILNGGGE
jgi:predicted secreted protein